MKKKKKKSHQEGTEPQKEKGRGAGRCIVSLKEEGIE